MTFQLIAKILLISDSKENFPSNALRKYLVYDEDILGTSNALHGNDKVVSCILNGRVECERRR